VLHERQNDNNKIERSENILVFRFSGPFVFAVPFSFFWVSQFIELVFAYVAKRAFPVFREIFECGARRYAGFRISLFWIVDVTTIDADVFCHGLT